MEPPLKFNCDYMCNCSFRPLESCRHAGLCFIEMITQKQIHPPPSSSGLISNDGSLESNAITQTSERNGRGPLSVIDGVAVCCTNTGAQRGPLFRLNKTLQLYLVYPLQQSHTQNLLSFTHILSLFTQQQFIDIILPTEGGYWLPK